MTGDDAPREEPSARAVMRVVVCGGGVIGASIANFLSRRRGVKPIVVERTGIACAASGKAGGFLARHWCDGTPLQQLARRSFDLHAELAEQSSEDWGYRRLVTYGGLSTERTSARRHAQSPIAWVSPRVQISQQLGSTADTAQVHPELFTAGMMRSAQQHGAELRLGIVSGMRQAAGRITGVVVDGAIIEADAVIIAMGPWSILAAAWLPLPAVYGLKGHSLVFNTGAAVPPEALFLELQETSGEVQSPEFLPRPDGTTYVCAISSDSPLPIDPAAVAPDPGAIERLERICAAASTVLASANIVARQACFRPITRDGLPLIGRVPGVEGAYVATGHSVWGILNAPATGEAMAELILDGAAHTVDLASFDPERLRPLEPASLQSLRAC